MTFLSELWLPIVLSAVFVFIVSSVIHMVLPVHKGDYKKMANEDAVLEALRTHKVAPGEYMFPCAGSMKEMDTPEMKAKLARGPVGWMTVLAAGGFSIGKSLVWWFVYSLLVSAMSGYIAWHGLGAGADYLDVFRLAGAAAMMAYGLGNMPASIWRGQRWGVTFKFILDGVAYGLVTGGAFGWLWP